MNTPIPGQQEQSGFFLATPCVLLQLCHSCLKSDSTRPGWKSPGFEARRALDVYQSPEGYGSGWWQAASQAKSVRGPAVRGYVRTLNILL